MSVSQKTRFAVFARDNFTCRYCARRPPEVILEVDHFHPQARGGSDKASNLFAACRECNNGKSDTIVLATFASVREDIKEQRQQHYDMLEVREKRAEEDDNTKGACRYWERTFPSIDGMLEESERRSIADFLRRLPAEKVKEAIDITFKKDFKTPLAPDQRFRYFCGTCIGLLKNINGQSRLR